MLLLSYHFREYPCDHVAMLNLAILNVGNPRMPTHETAVQLLHLLDRRFFQEESVLRDNSEQHQALNDVFLSVSYCKSQMFMSDQLARLHPDLTMPIFSGKVYMFLSFSFFVINLQVISLLLNSLVFFLVCNLLSIKCLIPLLVQFSL
jgi:hypothetical protein